MTLAPPTDLGKAAELQAKPKPADPCALVIFGVTGDLTKRLLFPALHNLEQEGLLPDQFAVIGFAYNDLSEDALREQMRHNLREAAAESGADPGAIERLVSRLGYVSSKFDDPSGYQRLAAKLEAAGQQTHGNCLFYLAVAPDFFLEVAQRLGQAGLLRAPNGAWRRLVVEKPFGHDAASARQLNLELNKVADESQIYRIDHYLGKETVQNILVMRFANGVFEPIWNRRYVDHVQITVAETVGVELRGGYYDHTGALRDMVPNHMLQLLALTAMEPPSSFSPFSLHGEQLKVLDAVPPLNLHECASCAVRAQYNGYRQEPQVGADSKTETFVALKLAVDNWRWAGVPFYLRTGKRLRTRSTEVAIQFRKAPLTLFRQAAVTLPQANRLVIHIQPEESISLEFLAKVPGPAVSAFPVAMNFSYRDYFGRENQTGYETLIYDAMIGDSSLFKPDDIIEAGWRIVDPVAEAWRTGAGDLQFYAAGSEGPDAARGLLDKDGREWRPLE